MAGNKRGRQIQMTGWKEEERETDTDDCRRQIRMTVGDRYG